MKPTVWTPLLLLLLIVASALAAENDLMTKKADHAEKIFRYLALGDLSKVEYEAGILETVTSEAGFAEKEERYQRYGEEFLKIVRALKEEAAHRNMAGSYYQFTRMAGMCFSCHDHLRDAKD
ncbi:MAG: hypothetical protein JXA28_13675 [Bacteroidetes bacterium]|nr:hypothetical protein [Bacteroidota bacterium]